MSSQHVGSPRFRPGEPSVLRGRATTAQCCVRTLSRSTASEVVVHAPDTASQFGGADLPELMLQPHPAPKPRQAKKLSASRPPPVVTRRIAPLPEQLHPASWPYIHVTPTADVGRTSGALNKALSLQGHAIVAAGHDEHCTTQVLRVLRCARQMLLQEQGQLPIWQPKLVRRSSAAQHANKARASKAPVPSYTLWPAPAPGDQAVSSTQPVNNPLLQVQPPLSSVQDVQPLGIQQHLNQPLSSLDNHALPLPGHSHRRRARSGRSSSAQQPLCYLSQLPPAPFAWPSTSQQADGPGLTPPPSDSQSELHLSRPQSELPLQQPQPGAAPLNTQNRSADVPTDSNHSQDSSPGPNPLINQARINSSDGSLVQHEGQVADRQAMKLRSRLKLSSSKVHIRWPAGPVGYCSAVHLPDPTSHGSRPMLLHITKVVAGPMYPTAMFNVPAKLPNRWLATAICQQLLHPGGPSHEAAPGWRHLTPPPPHQPPHNPASTQAAAEPSGRVKGGVRTQHEQQGGRAGGGAGGQQVSDPAVGPVHGSPHRVAILALDSTGRQAALRTWQALVLARQQLKRQGRDLSVILLSARNRQTGQQLRNRFMVFECAVNKPAAIRVGRVLPNSQ